MKNETINNVQLVLMYDNVIKVIKTYADIILMPIEYGDTVNIVYTAAGRKRKVNRFILKKGTEIIRAAKLPYLVELEQGQKMELCLTVTVK